MAEVMILFPRLHYKSLQLKSCVLTLCIFCRGSSQLPITMQPSGERPCGEELWSRCEFGGEVCSRMASRDCTAMNFDLSSRGDLEPEPPAQSLDS